MEPTTDKSRNHKLQLSLDLRIIIIVLLLIIVGMLTVWRPWQVSSNSARTISVTGDATLKAEPDEYDFNPTYSFTNADKSAAIAAATAKNQAIVAGLKQIGLTDRQIKTNIDGYENTDEVTNSSYSYTLSLTVTVSDKAQAQKVQDYLATTSPEGSITPSPTFSATKQKTLQAAARDQATKDARTKADQTAANLGFKISHVKTVEDGSGFSNPQPLMAQSTVVGKDQIVSAPTIALQPGQNTLEYSVTVTYYIK